VSLIVAFGEAPEVAKSVANRERCLFLDIEGEADLRSYH
jgi:hypothetical protein